MFDVNKTLQSGRLTRDPETRYTPGGMPITSFSIAVGYGKKTDAGWENCAEFVDVKAFKKCAERTAYLKKGDRVLVEGRLKQETWTASDGTNRSKVLINSDSVFLLSEISTHSSDHSNTQNNAGDQGDAEERPAI